MPAWNHTSVLRHRQYSGQQRESQKDVTAAAAARPTPATN